MRHKAQAQDTYQATLTRKREHTEGARCKGRWHVVCKDPDGNIKWEEKYTNLVVNEGLDYLLDVGFAGGAQVDPWYVGLLGSSPSPAAGWTDADLAAVDFVDYDEATLQEFDEGAVASQSVDNSASKATFTISSDASTIGGAFLISGSDKATPSGTLYCAGAFSGGDKSADDNDVLEITVTLTTADDGV